MTIYRLLLTTLLCVLTAAPAVRAQQRFLPAPDPADSAITVSLLTCSPGAEVYELEGHSALRLKYVCADPAGAIDVAVNWGVFDFATPGFVYRFVKGETDYSIGVAPTPMFLYQYTVTGRRVTEQTLSLTPSQAAAVIDLVEKNLQPENRIYRYNYVFDNCATRPLAIIERAIGDTLQLPTGYDSLGSDPTFRNEMRHFHADYPWYQFGIDLCLGSGVDRTITRRETMFAPVVLQQLVADAVIPTSHGAPGRPLVASTQTLVEGSPDALSQPTPWILTPMAAMLALLIITCAVTYHDIRGRHQSRWFDAILFGAYGVLGCIIAFLIFISVHEATSPNWLFLWLNPLCLLVPILIWTAPARRILKIYLTAAVIATVALGLLYIAGVQSLNPAFLPMMLAGIIRSLFIILPREKSKTT